MGIHLSAKRGDAIYITGVVTDSAGAVVNLSGGTLRFTAKLAVTDTDATSTTIKKYTGSGITHTNAAAGAYSIRLAPADTSNLTATTLYHWDLQFTTSDGDPFTTADGTLTIVADVGITTP